jgi:urease accessory protein
MAFGAMLGIAGVPLAGVELGIAASVLVLGAAVAFAAKPSLAIAAVLTAVFAVFHGHSHGTELPAAGSAVTYGIGFVAATLALHGAGLALGLLTQHNTGRFVARTAGAGVAVAGALLLITA